MEHGRNVLLNVEEEIGRGVGPVTTLLQHLVDLTVLAVLSNLKSVTLSPVQVRLKFALVGMKIAQKQLSQLTLSSQITITFIRKLV